MGENHRMVEKYKHASTRVCGAQGHSCFSQSIAWAWCTGMRWCSEGEWRTRTGPLVPHVPCRRWRQTHLADNELYPVAGAPGLYSSQRNGSPGPAERIALYTQTEATGLGHQCWKKLWGLEGTALEQGLAEPEGGEA